MPPLLIEFVDAVIQGAINRLQTDMPGLVATYNARTDTVVDLTVPPNGSYHFGATDTHSAFAFPQVEVAAVQGQTGRFDLAHTAADHDVWLNVVVWVEGKTGEVAPVYRELLGLARCVISSLSPKNAIVADSELSNERGIYWRVSEAIPLDQDDPQRDLQKWRVPVFLQFRVELLEQFG